MLLMIDNYDSFTFNLVHYFEILGQTVSVYAHDSITLDEIADINPSCIVLSPGPKRPENAGVCLSLIQRFHCKTPILGICLGHQCIAQAFGSKIIHAQKVMHGKTSLLHHKKVGLFRNLPSPYTVTRYHSLVVDQRSLSSCFAIDAFTDDAIMAIRHRQYPLFGLQFHPEAILSEYGLPILERFIYETNKRNFRNTYSKEVAYREADASGD